jgi:DNA repair protein RadC
MVKIQDLDKKDKPREKLISNGAANLSDIELLQVIIGSGVKGSDVTKISKQIKKLLELTSYQPSLDQLLNIRGVSDATATKLVALFELAGRKNIKEILIKSPEDIASQVPELRTAKQEHLVVLTLDGANRLIEKRIISIGTLNSSLVHPREVFSDAITDRAASIVAIHNHPSGTLEPSDADIEITKRLKQSGELLGIKLLDHIIITKSDHYSFTNDNRL